MELSLKEEWQAVSLSSYPDAPASAAQPASGAYKKNGLRRRDGREEPKGREEEVLWSAELRSHLRGPLE